MENYKDYLDKRTKILPSVSEFLCGGFVRHEHAIEACEMASKNITSLPNDEEIEQEALEKYPIKSTATGAMQNIDEAKILLNKATELIDFANFIGDRPLPEYSKSTNKWRWWNNNTRAYDYATTEQLLDAWKKSINVL